MREEIEIGIQEIGASIDRLCALAHHVGPLVDATDIRHIDHAADRLMILRRQLHARIRAMETAE